MTRFAYHTHSPGGGDKKIATTKLHFKEQAKPKVGSLENADHQPGGGHVTIVNERLHFHETATPKIGSH